MQLSKIDIAGLMFVGVLLVWQDARSADMVMHFGSKHYGSGAAESDFNETNLGIGMKYRLGWDFSMRGGVYDNSYSNSSVYFGGDWHSADRVFNYGIQAGLVSGYRSTEQGRGNVTPYILPYMSLTTGAFTTEVGCLPPVMGGIGVLTLSVRMEVF
jgi:hypothetical protein